jgi:hypothetical protein
MQMPPASQALQLRDFRAYELVQLHIVEIGNHFSFEYLLYLLINISN